MNIHDIIRAIESASIEDKKLLAKALEPFLDKHFKNSLRIVSNHTNIEMYTSPYALAGHACSACPINNFLRFNKETEF